MTRILIALLLAASLSLCSAQQPPSGNATPTGRSLQRGVLIPSVSTQAAPDQSYALYVPSNYAPDRNWPIIFVFDPGAQGSRPLTLMKDAAERYGYILAGSNNSRNGDMKEQLEAPRQMWNDTRTYLAIDSRRIYFAGFSGGARLASYLAQVCDCSRAVFLNGAALLQGAPPVSERKFAAFSLAGLGDFNYAEILDLDNKLESLEQPHFFLRFNGEHEWAPATAWDQAFAWATLLEMKNGVRDRDSALIAAELSESVERIQKQAASGESYLALQETRGMITVFDGLTATTSLSELAATLEKDPRTRAGAKSEKSEIDRQHIRGDAIIRSIISLQEYPSSQAALSAILSQVRELQERLIKEKNPSEKRVLQRTLGSVFIMSMETGGAILQKGNPANAQPYFQIAAETSPDSSWPFLSLARCHAARGNKKDAIRDLKRAIEIGYPLDSLTDFVKKDPNLAQLALTGEYKAMVTSTAPTVPK